MILRTWTAALGTLIAIAASGAGPRDDVQRAAAEPDPARRAAAVLPLLDRGDAGVYAAVLDVWAGCGRAALPVLRPLVADESRSDRAALVDTLVRAGGKDATADLERLLQGERTYWNNLGLNLDDAAKVPAARFDCLLTILRHLRDLGYHDDRGLVRAIRAQFDDHPLLRDYGKAAPGTACPVVAAADAILAAE